MTLYEYQVNKKTDYGTERICESTENRRSNRYGIYSPNVEKYRGVKSPHSIMKNLFSIDVEDWFHILDIPSTPPPETWDRLPSRVKTYFHRLLDLLDERRIKATCFFLGWTAEKYKSLIHEAVRRGHEIASHGLCHQLVYEMQSIRFLEDIVEAKQRLEDVSGQAIRGYRAPGFSLTQNTPFFFDRLIEGGYEYDSSVFPCSREHGGIRYNCYFPHTIRAPHGQIREFPISTAMFLGQRHCFSGGGYFRFFPYAWISAKMRDTNRQDAPAVFYIHPRDIDKDQPRLPMNWRRRFMSYYGLQRAETKLKQLLRDFEFTSFADFMQDQTNQRFFSYELDQPFPSSESSVQGRGSANIVSAS
jgi:polysaccharide deacetylase family protein (PEP-CTERM system associated)